MITWRCPHCETPQPEASRCWVCHRSSTSCGTCRHFRQSVAARTGFCGLDRRRTPLDGDEVRACWEDAATPIAPDPSIPGLLDLLTERVRFEPAPPTETRPAADIHPRRRVTTPSTRDWVEVEA